MLRSQGSCAGTLRRFYLVGMDDVKQLARCGDLAESQTNKVEGLDMKGA
jgi:hypothetical protein